MTENIENTILDKAFAIFTGHMFTQGHRGKESYYVRIDKLLKILDEDLFPMSFPFYIKHHTNQELSPEILSFVNSECGFEESEYTELKTFIVFRDEKFGTTNFIANKCVKLSEEMLEHLKQKPMAQTTVNQYVERKCEEQNGLLTGAGMVMCNLPSKDAGKLCRGTNDCEGRCMAIKDNPLNFLSFIDGIHVGRCSSHKLRQLNNRYPEKDDNCMPIIVKGSINSTYCDGE